MSNYSVLRIGPIDSEIDKASVLRDAITRHFQDGAPSSPLPSSNGSNENLLSISNRYFDATILLLGLNESIDEADGGIHEEDGILLVFDASLSTSFDALSQIHATATQNSQDGDLLRLCIGTAHGPSPLSDGSKKCEEEYSRRVLWCLDHGYEYVEVDLTEEGMKRGFDERDKDGFARVIEAIGSCMWSSRVMKQRNLGALLAGAAGAKTGATANEMKKDEPPKDTPKPNDSECKAKEKETNATTLTAEISSSSPTNDVEREEAAMASLMKGVETDQQSSETDDQADTEQQSNQQDEMAFHQLESVLSEAKLIREASKNNSMSDEERRERAGDTAMKLMGLLDRLGFDDDSDEGEGCCSSDEEGP